MVEEGFKEKLNKVRDALEESRGSIYLFAVLKMDELTDKWTVVFSSEWVKEVDFDEAFTEIRSKLLEVFGEDINSFARIGIFSAEDHLSQLMMDKYDSGDIIKEDQQINGNLIHEGYIVQSTKLEESNNTGSP